MYNVHYPFVMHYLLYYSITQAASVATVAVDLDGDGEADVLVTGEDLDGDGIPDALQEPVTEVPLSRSPHGHASRSPYGHAICPPGALMDSLEPSGSPSARAQGAQWM